MNPSSIYWKRYLIICKFQEKRTDLKKSKNVQEKTFMEHFIAKVSSYMCIYF